MCLLRISATVFGCVEPALLPEENRLLHKHFSTVATSLIRQAFYLTDSIWIGAHNHHEVRMAPKEASCLQEAIRQNKLHGFVIDLNPG